VMADVIKQNQFLELAQERFITTTTILGLFLSLLGVFTIWLVARKSIRPLTEMTTLVTSIAEGEGDLTQRLNINYRDETGKLSLLLNTFIEKLQNLVKQLLPVASDVSELSSEGRQFSVETSIQMLEQESLIEDMVLTMNEMAASAQQIAASAERTSQFVQYANDATTVGTEVLQKRTVTIDHISQSVRQSEVAVQSMAKNVDNILKIISVFDDIALKINHLTNQSTDNPTVSKNKAEPDLVTEQIRNLASQTHQAVADMRKQLTIMQQSNQLALNTIDLSGQHVSETVELAQQAESALNDINQAIEEVTEMTLEIAAATEQQSAACDEVNHNLSEVSRLVHLTSKGAQQLRGVGNELDLAAGRLQEKLALFKV